MACETCVHATPYPAPSKPEPEKPTPGGPCFVDHYLFEFRYRQWINWIDRQNRFENNVECRRFPEFVERKKVESCGEFTQDPFTLD